MSRRSNYDKFPTIRVPVGRECVWQGWRDILLRIGGEISRGAQCISVEIYPGVFEQEVLAAFVDALHPAHVFLRMVRTAGAAAERFRSWRGRRHRRRPLFTF